jgi:hypothetical protein
MTREEREQLVQRYYDGETVGAEARLVERMLEEDPETRRMLESLREISDSIRVDVESAVADEDFSAYWADIKGKLPKGPLTLETGQEEGERRTLRAADDLLTRAPRALEERLPLWRRWSLLPVLATAAVTAALVLALRLPGTDGERSSGGTATGNGGSAAPVAAGPVDYSIEIEEIDSPGPLVMVQQESDDVPAIIWIQES